MAEPAPDVATYNERRGALAGGSPVSSALGCVWDEEVAAAAAVQGLSKHSYMHLGSRAAASATRSSRLGRPKSTPVEICMRARTGMRLSKVGRSLRLDRHRLSFDHEPHDHCLMVTHDRLALAAGRFAASLTKPILGGNSDRDDGDLRYRRALACYVDQLAPSDRTFCLSRLRSAALGPLRNIALDAAHGM